MGLKVGLLLLIVYAAACASPIFVSADVFSPKPSPPSFGRKKLGKIGPHTRRPSSIALEPSMPSFEGPAKKQVLGSAHSPTVSSHRSHDSARKHLSIPKSSYSIPPPHYYHRDVFSPKPSPPSFDRKEPRKIGPHTRGPSNIAFEPSMPSFEGPAKGQVHGSAHSPTVSSHRSPDLARKHFGIHKSSYPIPPPNYYHRGPSLASGLSPSPSPMSWSLLAPGTTPTIPPGHFNMHIYPPAISPLGYSWKKHKALPPSKILTLPPPPPNKDCSSITCVEPLTNTPPGCPCRCVWPIQVKLRLGITVYTFFTLVTELPKEIAASVALNSSQVRIMGADAASEHLDKSTVLINLVPRRVKFDGPTALSIYKKFWNRQVLVKDSLFGAYEVLYVHYPGLPPTPPSPSIISTIDDGPQAGRNGSGRTNKPLGVDVPRRKKDGIAGSMIAVIVLSIFTAFIICAAIAWLLLLKCGACIHQPHVPHPTKISSPSKPSDSAGSITFGSMANTTSMFFTSGALTYTGSAKTFSLKDIERATNNFYPSRILGEGGFGVVYSGMLDDGQKVAVKVLKRDDQHGTREFLAEVEMLSRLHHRNLVKLIGTCTEGRTHCLVYELIPNGSVESHLHGVDKETDPLDWDARMKIALGAARGLAYLHEDSSPCVIHRDFKASNILLDHDFTPKVSDFGLARTALDEGNKHISTHVMGTFGYLAPEYAMTGHLLVKSDVYSYGVVLLELLTGQKPVDLSQPLGQENLVTYARPLLTSKDGLETIIDVAIKSSVSYDTIAKVAAIASMCVQPEVSHRPFMGEVVQALKLVCNEFDQAEEQETGSCSQEKLLLDAVNGKVMEAPPSHHLLPLSTSDLLSAPEGQELGSFRRHSCSGPIRTGKRRKFWQRLRSLSSGSMSDHGYPLKARTGNS